MTPTPKAEALKWIATARELVLDLATESDSTRLLLLRSALDYAADQIGKIDELKRPRRKPVTDSPHTLTGHERREAEAQIQGEK